MNESAKPQFGTKPSYQPTNYTYTAKYQPLQGNFDKIEKMDKYSPLKISNQVTYSQDKNNKFSPNSKLSNNDKSDKYCYNFNETSKNQTMQYTPINYN